MIRNILHALRITKEFGFWCLDKLLAKLIGFHFDFAKELGRETGFVIFFWMLATAGVSVIMGLAGGIYFTSPEIGVATALGCIKFSCAYLLFTVITIAFKSFTREREEIMKRLRETEN
jgi:hypothetical protein